MDTLNDIGRLVHAARLALERVDLHTAKMMIDRAVEVAERIDAAGGETTKMAVNLREGDTIIDEHTGDRVPVAQKAIPSSNRDGMLYVVVDHPDICRHYWPGDIVTVTKR